MNTKKLQIEQLDTKFKAFSKLQEVSTPSSGWIKAIRTSVGMSMQQLANRLSITKQSVREIELREKDGSISIKNLREIAVALEMELVYGFVPKDGSLDALINRKSRELASKIVSRTSNSMKLEDQENSKKRLVKAIEERSAQLKHEMPKVLWD